MNLSTWKDQNTTQLRAATPRAFHSITYTDEFGRWSSMQAEADDLEAAVAYIECNGGEVAMVNGHWQKGYQP